MISPRQIIFGKRFRSPFCKIGEVELAYDTSSSNDTEHPRAYFALYVEPNDNGTGHKVFKLQTKRVVTTQKCIAKTITDDDIDIVSELGEQEGNSRWYTILEHSW